MPRVCNSTPSLPMRLLLALALCCAACTAAGAASASASASASGGGSSPGTASSLPDTNEGWRTGRASFYGIDGWSIHKGACGLGYQYKNVGTGWDVAAIADASPEFQGSCGRCYEVRCDPRSTLVDGYGNTMDRASVCKAGAASVVVRTVDACPCEYPGNAYSNKRWCCGDNSNTQGTHFDLSIWAFEKLTDVKWGVAGIQFRRVDCEHFPAQPAPDGPTPMPPSEQPKALGYGGTAFDPPGGFEDTPLVKRFDDAGAAQGAVRPMDPATDATAGLPVVTHGQILEADSTSGSGAAASATTSASQGPAPADAGADNGCTDVAPSGSTCEKQKADGNCGQPWLLSGNFCRATCGRCSLGGGATPSPPTPPPAPASSGFPSPSPSPAGCADVQPPGQSSTCSQFKAWGKCDEQWLKDGAYCAATCGRCGGAPVQAFDGKGGGK